jgi:hypothetical protein
VAQGSVALDTAAPQPGEPAQVYAVILVPSGAAPGQTLEATFSAALASDPNTPVIIARKAVIVGAEGKILAQVPWTPPKAGEYLVSVSVPGSSPAQSRIVVGGSPTAAGRPTLVLSAGLANIGSIEQNSERTIPLEITAYNGPATGVRVEVLDAAGAQVEPLTPPVDILAGQTIKYYLKVKVGNLSGNASLGDRKLVFQAYSDAGSSNVDSVDMIIHKANFAGLPGFEGAATFGALAAGGAAGFFRRRIGGR